MASLSELISTWAAARDGSSGGIPPFGTEQALNTEVYRMLSARSYSDAAHICM